MDLPRDDLAKQEFLQKVAETFEEGKKYSEEEVNIKIKQFGFEDFALFRRELVNFNYLGKDSYKGEYWLKQKSLSLEELDRVSKLQEKLKD